MRRICLVGGSTRIPLVRALLAEAFPEAHVHEEINPDLAVGLGASVQAAMLVGEPVDRILVDVASHSLGILVVGEQDWEHARPDTFAPVLRRNTVLPTDQRERFYTMVDHQESLAVQVFQGESARASDNREVGSFDFPLEPRPVHSPIDLSFAYDLDGVVRVTVSQPGTRNEKTVQLRLSDATELAVGAPVLRKARALLAQLDEQRRAALTALIAAYESAGPAARERAEEALLDFLIDADDQDDEDD